MPSLDPYPGHTPLSSESVDVAEYEKLPDGEDICPERHVSLFSSKYLFYKIQHCCLYVEKYLGFRLLFYDGDCYVIVFLIVVTFY